QFRHHMTHEIRIGTRHMCRRHHEAVAATARKHLFHVVGDLLGPADDSTFGVAATANTNKVTRRRIGLAAFSDPPFTDAEHSFHAAELIGGEWLVYTLCRQVAHHR